MRKLLDFLISKRHWFLFVLLEIISFVLIYYNHAYQRNIMFGSANVIMGHVATVSSNVVAYLHLREVNRELLERNGQLEMELLDLQDQLEMMHADTVLFRGAVTDSTGSFPYRFIAGFCRKSSERRAIHFSRTGGGTENPEGSARAEEHSIRRSRVGALPPLPLPAGRFGRSGR